MHIYAPIASDASVIQMMLSQGLIFIENILQYCVRQTLSGYALLYRF